jgi:hypothetical protein
MADVSHIITLGIGTPGGIEPFLLLGLSMGEGGEPEPGGPEPERFAVDAVDNPRVSIDAVLRI